MGRIIITEFVSLDGVMEDPDGGEDFEYGGWSFDYDLGDSWTKMLFSFEGIWFSLLLIPR